MIINVDMGNTRMKWQLLSTGLSESGAIRWADWSESSLALKKLCSTIKENSNSPEDVKVFVSSVASPRVEELFNIWLQTQLTLSAHYISVEKWFAGLTAAYDDVASLGVDRWLAMLAVHHLSQDFSVPADSIVIDAGSATTIDYVNAEGVHEGGLILPGVGLMAKSMNSDTHALNPAENSESLTLPQNWQPACDTLSCIRNGLVAMQSGLVKEAISHYKQRTNVRVWLTGGDASLLLPMCELQSEKVTLRHNLVLEGMDVWRVHN